MQSCFPAWHRLAQDIVVTGHDLNEIGIMIVPNREEIETEGYKLTEENGLIVCDLLKGEIEHRLRERATKVSGSSVTRKTRPCSVRTTVVG